MGHANNHRGHKKTIKCPVAGCKYTSRVFVSLGKSEQDFKDSVSSLHCPIHQKELIDLTPKPINR